MDFLRLRWVLLCAVLCTSAILFLEYTPIASAQASAKLTVLQSDTNRVVLELEIAGYEKKAFTVGSSTYTLISVSGLGHTNEAGKPQLPIKGALVGIPPGAQATLRVISDESSRDTLQNPPVPAPTARVRFDPREALPRYEGNAIVPNSAAYSANQFYPAAAARIASVGDWRSQHYASVEFHPFQYNAATRQLIFHQRVRLEITLAYPKGLSPAQLGGTVKEGAFEPVLRDALVNYSSARNWRSKNATSKAPAPKRSPSYPVGTWYRIGVDSDGIYRIMCAQLASAGVDLAQLDPSTIQLFKQGVELARNVAGNTWSTCDSTDYIEFFGQAPVSKYTNTNVYWLTFGGAAGKPMPTRTGTVTGTETVATTYTNTVHAESNLIYRNYAPDPISDDFEHWYWSYVGAGSSQSINVSLTNFAVTGIYSPTLLADLIGGTANTHQTQIDVNSCSSVDNTSWGGLVERRATISLSESCLQPGGNTIIVRQVADFIFTNYFDISYQSYFTATNNTIRFKQPVAGAWQYRIGGFTDPTIELFDISDPLNVAQITPDSNPCPSSCQLWFADAISAPREYLALGVGQIKNPSVVHDNFSDLLSTANGADYIIIAASPLVSDGNLNQLAAYRSSQGLRVKFVDVQDVYDQFSDGLVDPQAIHDFLFYAYQNWTSPAPQFVLLVGGGNFDPKEYCVSPPIPCSQVSTAPNSTLLPPYLRMVDPYIGETASDNRLVAFNVGNTLPNMAIGRLPAYTSADVDVMVSKILNYEQNPASGDWRNKITFVADNAYSSNGVLDSAGNFWDMSDLVASNPTYMPSGLLADRIYYNPCDSATYPQCTLPYQPYTNASLARNAIVSAINSGRLIVNYIGHSFITNWAGEQLFTVSEVNSLANGGKMPVMLEMTCYTGYYIYPGLASLAETNVRRNANGAVASWAATGLGVATGHDFLDRGFFDAIMNQSVRQIGLATVAGKTNLWLNSGGANLDLIDTFDLFGDPATRLQIQFMSYLPFIQKQ